MKCVFRPCTATYALVEEQRQPWERDGADMLVRRIPIHETGGSAWFGRCPASLMSAPLTDEKRRLIIDAEERWLRMSKDRAAHDNAAMRDREAAPPAMAGDVQASSAALGGTGRTKTDVSAYWSGRDLDEPGVTASGTAAMGASSGMATVGEVKASVAYLNQQAVEVLGLLGSVVGRVEQMVATSQNTFADSQHSDTTAHTAAALQSANDTVTSLRLAIEAAETYSGTL